MSKDIVIQEGGVNKNLNSIKKILTDEQSGGSCNWIPEDEAERGTKTITKNGTYKASDDDLYGYSKVTVNVKGGGGGSGASSEVGSSVVGTDPNDNSGNEYSHTVNENGEVEVTKLPSSIAVTKNPDKMLYQNGDTFNPSGIIVHAYYKDGGDYGTVQNSELTFEPMEISADLVTTGKYTGRSIVVDDYTYPYISCMETYSPVSGYYNGAMTGKLAVVSNQGYDDAIWCFYANSTIRIAYIGNAFIIASSEPFNGCGERPNPSVGISSWTSGSNGETYTYDNKTVYYRVTSYYNSIVSQPLIEQSDVGSSYTYESIAWAMIYGGLSSSKQTITVKWNRPADSKTLTTTIEVEVTASSSGGQSSGNTSGGEESGGGGSHGF